MSRFDAAMVALRIVETAAKYNPEISRIDRGVLNSIMLATIDELLQLNCSADRSGQ